MRKAFIFLLLLLPGFCFPQSRYDTAKFNLIKEAVVFYSTDPVSFGDQGKLQLSCDAMQYICLQSYCTDNKLVSVWNNVKSWRDNFSPNSKADLVILKDTIRNALLKPEKNEAAGFREKNIGTFDKYANDIIQNIADNSLLVSPVNRSTPIKEDSTKEKNEEPSTMAAQTESSFPVIALFAAVIALILAALSLGLLISSNKKMKERIDRRRTEIKELKKKTEDEAHEIQLNTSKNAKPLEDKIKLLEDRILVLERKLKSGNGTEPVKATSPKEIINPLPKKKTTEPVPVAKTWYAKLPDLNNGSGFSDSSLSLFQNGEQIYEVEIKGNEIATFAITNDPKAQKYALSDYNHYLAEACEFINQPIPNCKIYTKKYGTLAKRGNEWMIHEKAKIEFA